VCSFPIEFSIECRNSPRITGFLQSMVFSVEVFQGILFPDNFGTQYGFLPYNQYTQERKRTA